MVIGPKSLSWVHKVPSAPRLMPKQSQGNSLHRPDGDRDRRHPSNPLRLSQQPPLKRADFLWGGRLLQPEGVRSRLPTGWVANIRTAHDQKQRSGVPSRAQQAAQLTNLLDDALPRACAFLGCLQNDDRRTPYRAGRGSTQRCWL